MNPLILAMPGNHEMAHSLAHQLAGELGRFEIRRFPDGESFVRVDSDVQGRHIVIVCTLDRPDEKFVPLALLAAAVRHLRFREAGFLDIIGIGVHALFAGHAYVELKEAGVSRIVTCNSVPHASNGIDVALHLAAAIRDLALPGRGPEFLGQDGGATCPAGA